MSPVYNPPQSGAGAAPPTIQRFENLPGFENNATAMIALVTVNGSMQLWNMIGYNDIFPGNMTASTLFLDMSGTGNTSASASTVAQTLRFSVGIYTQNAVSQLTLINSASSSLVAAAATNQSTLWAGARYLTLHTSAFVSPLTFTQTSYWMGAIFSTSGGNPGLSYLGGYVGISNVTRSGYLGAGSVTASSNGWEPWAGVMATAAIPTVVHMSNVSKVGVSGGFAPHVVLEAVQSRW